MIAARIYLKFILAALSAGVSIRKSKAFFKLLDKFDRFDSFTLQTQCPSNTKAQSFHTIFAVSVEFFYFSMTWYYADVNVCVLILWTSTSGSITLMTVQYSEYVRMLRERYKMSNLVFSKSEF